MSQPTKQLPAIALTEQQYQELSLKSGIITDELKDSVQMAIAKTKGEVAS